MSGEVKKNVVDVSEVSVISAEGQHSAAIIDTRRVAELNTLMKLSAELTKSGMFPQLRNGGQVLAVILAGHERQYGAMTSLMNIHVINGRLGYSAQMIASELRKMGVTYDVIETDTEHCKIRFNRKGQESFTYQWTVKDAQRAKKLPAKPDSVWVTYPQDMLFSRCLTAGGRKFAPDALMGLSLTDELPNTDNNSNRVDDSEPKKSATESLADRVEETVGSSGQEEPQDDKPPEDTDSGDTVEGLLKLTKAELVTRAMGRLLKFSPDDVAKANKFLSRAVDSKRLNDPDIGSDKNNKGQLCNLIIDLQELQSMGGEQGKAGF